MLNSSNIAVAISNVPEAALYFDSVVPVSIFFDNSFKAIQSGDPNRILDEENAAPRELLVDLLPPALRNGKVFTDLEHLYQSGVDAWLKWMEGVVQKRATETYLIGFDSWLSELERFMTTCELTECPIITYPDVLPEALSGESTPTDFAITMTSLHLVNAQALAWEQIHEFRKDERSRMKLRRLRLFFLQNYDGRDRRYVEDDFHRLLDDYHSTVSSWGFETRAQVVSMLLSSKWVARGAGGSALSVLLGEPATAIAAAVGGLSIEVGNVLLEVTKRKHALRRLTRESPISYVVDLQTAASRA